MNDLKQRTKQFALKIISLVEGLPKSPSTQVIGRQILRSGTSVGANYRAACRAKSRADFISKMGTVEEEVDETIYWLELLIDAGFMDPTELQPLLKESDEITAIIVASIKTARRNQK